MSASEPPIPASPSIAQRSSVEGPNPLRRHWCAAWLGTAAAASVAAAVLPFVRFLTPAGPTADSPAPSILVAGPVDAFPPGAASFVASAASPILVLRLRDGAFRAFVARCTHLGCTVGYRPALDDLHCACHGAVFDPRTGAARQGPAQIPLHPIPVEVRDGLILLHT